LGLGNIKFRRFSELVGRFGIKYQQELECQFGDMDLGILR